jgi:acyl-CoA reductase-like NAD-dependent aldehyde dehydrogenase
VAVTAVERKLLIGGEWVETGDWLEVRSPYSGDVVGRVAKAGADETRRAIDAAEHAMQEPLPAHKRAEILVRVAGMLGRRHDEVARLISDEAGKPMKAARIEAKRAMSTFTMAAVEARKLAGEVVPMDGTQAGEGKLGFTLRTPIGIVGAISPFNFPLNLVGHKLAPALAAGCAVVLKPAAATPLSALLLAELETEAGLPPGWLNVLVGPSSEIGDVLVDDERVKALTFTGSGPVGWKLRERAPRKKVLLELGNATPAIVAADADVDAAAEKLAGNAFSFAGQSCISVQRIYVERASYDAFVERLLPLVDGLKIGDPADEDTDVGPVIDEDARDRILSWIDEARTSGAEILADGDREPAARRQGVDRGGLRPGLHRHGRVIAGRGVRARERHALRAPGGRLHLEPAQCAPRRRRAPLRRRDGERGAHVPRRPDALRRRQGLGQHARGAGLRCPGADRGARDRRAAPRLVLPRRTAAT